MKHILNDIPKEVKDDIRKQHDTGKGKQIDVEKMKNLFNIDFSIYIHNDYSLLNKPNFTTIFYKSLL